MAAVGGKPVVAVDVDEVLAQFVAALATFHNENYGSNLSVANFHSYRFSEVWGGTDDDARVKVHGFFESDHFRNISPVPGALEAVTRLKKNFDLVVVTSRQHSIADETQRWIGHHFPGVFSNIVFGNHWGLSGEKRTKSELCRELNARVLIDDLVDYARQCSEVVERVVIFGEYPWNHGEGPHNARRASTWDVACALIEETLLATQCSAVSAGAGVGAGVSAGPNP